MLSCAAFVHEECLSRGVVDATADGVAHGVGEVGASLGVVLQVEAIVDIFVVEGAVDEGFAHHVIEARDGQLALGERLLGLGRIVAMAAGEEELVGGAIELLQGGTVFEQLTCFLDDGFGRHGAILLFL